MVVRYFELITFDYINIKLIVIEQGKGIIIKIG